MTRLGGKISSNKVIELLFFILPWYFYLESFSSRINIIHLGFHLNFHPQTWFPYSKRTFPQIKPSSIIVSNRRVYSRVVLLQGYGLNHGETISKFSTHDNIPYIYIQFPRQRCGNFRLNFISAVVVSNLKLYHASITGKLSLGFPFPLLQVEFHDSMEF